MCALTGGIMLYLWHRVSEQGGHAWALYGWFCGLMMCGSIFGAVAYGAWMMHLVNDFNGHRNPNQTLEASFNAGSYGWLPLFYVTYSIEFMCLSKTKHDRSSSRVCRKHNMIHLSKTQHDRPFNHNRSKTDVRPPKFSKTKVR